MSEANPGQDGYWNVKGHLRQAKRSSCTVALNTETLSVQIGKRDSLIPCKVNCCDASLALTITGTTTNTHSARIQVRTVLDFFSNRHVTRPGISSSQRL